MGLEQFIKEWNSGKNQTNKVIPNSSVSVNNFMEQKTENQNFSNTDLREGNYGSIYGHMNMNDAINQRANNQGAFAVVGNGLIQAGVGMIGELASTPGYIANIGSDMSELEKGIGGQFVKAGDWIKENIAELAPVYMSTESQDQVFAPFNSEWFGNFTAQLGPTLGLMAATMLTEGATSTALAAALSRLPGAAKYFEMANVFLKGEQFINKAANLGFQAGKQALINRTLENTMEGRETYNRVYEEALKNGFDAEQAKTFANDAASMTFKWNYAAMTTDFLQYLGINKALGNLGILGKIGVFGLEAGTEAIEEGGQFVIQEEAFRNAQQAMGLETDPNTLMERVGEYLGDKEMQKAMVQGAMGGAVFSAIGSTMQKFSDNVVAKSANVFKNSLNTGVRVREHLNKAQEAAKKGDMINARLHFNNSFIEQTLGSLENNTFENQMQMVDDLLKKSDAELALEFEGKELPFGMSHRGYLENQKETADLVKKNFEAAKKANPKADVKFQKELALKNTSREVLSKQLISINGQYNTEVSTQATSLGISPIGLQRFKLVDQIKALEQVIAKSQGDTTYLSNKKSELESELSEMDELNKDNKDYKKDKTKLKKYNLNAATDIAIDMFSTENEMENIGNEINTLNSKSGQATFKQNQIAQELENLKKLLDETSNPEEYAKLEKVYAGNKEAIELIKTNKESRAKTQAAQAEPIDTSNLTLESIQARYENKNELKESEFKEFGVTTEQEFLDKYNNDKDFKELVDNKFKEQPESTDLVDLVDTNNKEFEEDAVKNTNKSSPNNVQYQEFALYEVAYDTNKNPLYAKIKGIRGVYKVIYGTESEYNINWSKKGFNTLKDKEGNLVKATAYTDLEVTVEDLKGHKVGSKVEFQISESDIEYINSLGDKVKTSDFPVTILVNGKKVGRLSNKENETQLIRLRNDLYKEYTQHQLKNQGKPFKSKIKTKVLDIYPGRFININQQNKISDVYNEEVILGIGVTDADGKRSLSIPNKPNFKIEFDTSNMELGFVYLLVKNEFNGKYYPMRLFTQKMSALPHLRQEVIRLLADINEDNFLDRVEQIQSIVRIRKLDENGVKIKNYAPEVNGNFHTDANKLFKEGHPLYISFTNEVINLDNPTEADIRLIKARLFYDYLSLDNAIAQIESKKFLSKVNTPAYNKRIIEEGRLTTDLNPGQHFHSPKFIISLVPTEPAIQIIPATRKRATKSTKPINRINKTRLVSSNEHKVWNEKEELTWFKENFPNFPIHVLDTLKTIRNRGGIEAWGLFTEAAIYINKNAGIGTTYHEAFHLVFTLGLTNEQQDSILKEYKAKYPKATEGKTDLEVEEMLADEFMEYTLTEGKDTSLIGIIKNLFRKLYNTINAALTDKITINELFYRANNGVYRDLKPIVGETVYTKFRNPILNDMIGISSYTELQQRLQLINNTLFNEMLHDEIGLEENKFKSVGELLNGLLRTNNLVDTAHYAIYEQLMDHFYNEDWSAIKDEYSDISKQIESTTSNLFTFDEEGNPIAGPLYFSAIKDLERIYQISVEFEEYDENNEKESWQMKEFAISMQDKLSPKMKLWFSGIEKRKKVGENNEIQYDSEFGEPFAIYEDGQEVKNYLQQKLHSVLSSNEMVARLEALIDVKPYIAKILDDISIDANLKTQLFQLVSSDYPHFKTVIQEGVDIQTVSSNRNTLENNLRTDLMNGFLNNSKAIISEKEGKYVYNVDKIETIINGINNIDPKDYSVRVPNLFSAIGFIIEPEVIEYLNKDSVTEENNTKIINTSEDKYNSILGLNKNVSGIKQFLEELIKINNQKSNKTPFDDFRNPVVESLINQIKIAQPEYYQSSHRNLDNEQVYNHIRKSFFGKFIGQLNNGTFPFETYHKDPTYKRNFFIGENGWLYEKNQREANGYRFNIVEGLRENYDKTSYTDYSDLQFEKVAYALFMGSNYNARKQGIAEYIMPILETAPVQLSFKGLVIGALNVTDEPVMLDEIADAFVNIAFMEKERLALKEKLNNKNINLKVHNANNTLYFLNKDGSPLFNLSEVNNSQEFKDKILSWMNEIYEAENVRLEKLGFIEQMKGTNMVATPTNIKLYLFNSIIMRTHMSQATVGDLGFYKNTEDLFKRAKEIWSPGTHLDTDRLDVNEKYAAIFIKDISLKAEWVDALKESLTKKGIKQNVIDKLVKSYESVDIADAQAFITLERWMEQERGLGRITDKTQFNYDEISAKRIVPTDMLNIFQTRKPFVFAHNFIELDSETTMITPLQIKNSEMVLLPEMIKGRPQLEALYNRLQAVQTETGLTAMAAFESAVKTGLFGYKELSNINESIVHKLSNSDWRLQMETPEHHIEAKNKLGSQLWKLVTANIKSDNVLYPLISEFNSLMIGTIKSSSDKLQNELKDNDKIKKELLSEANKRGMTYKILSLLGSINNTDEKSLFKVALNPFFTYKFQNLVNSMFKNRITNIKFNGGSYFNTSSLGYDDLQIVFDKEGNVDFVEVMLPAWMRGMQIGETTETAREGIVYRIPTEGKYSMFKIKVKGFLPDNAGGAIIMPHGVTTIAGLDFDIDKVYAMFFNLKKNENDVYEPIKYLDESFTVQERYNNYIKEEESKEEIRNFIKENEINIEELISLQSFGDKLLEGNGKIIYDKLNEMGIFNFDMLNDMIDDELVMSLEDFEKLPIAEQNTQKARDNRKLEIIREILSKSLTESFTPGGFETLKENANNIEEWEGNKMGNLMPFTNSTFAEIYRRMMDGSKLIGIAAIHNKSHALFQHRNMTFADIPLLLTTKQKFKIGNDIYSYKRFGKEKQYWINDTQQTGDAEKVWKETVKLEMAKLGKFEDVFGNKLVSDNIAEILAAVVDNGKDPLSSKFNLNLYTADTMLTLLHMGYDLKTAQEFLAQPILKELVSRINNTDLTEDEAFIMLNNEFKKELVTYFKDEETQEQANKILQSQVYQDIDADLFELYIKSYKNIKDSNAEVKKGFYMTQLRVLANFQKLKKNEAKDVGNIIRVINTGDNGAGPTNSDNLLKHDIEDKILNDDNGISGAKEFISDMSLPINMLRQKGVNDVTTFFEEKAKLPFNTPPFKMVRNMMNNAKPNARLNATDLDKMNFNFLTALSKNFVSSSSSIVLSFPNEFLKRSAEEATKAIKGEDNIHDLLKFFTTEPVEKNSKILRLQLKNINGLNDRQLEQMEDMFNMLYKSEPEFAQKFIDYSYHTNGFEFTHYNFMQVLPYDIIGNDLVEHIENKLGPLNDYQVRNFYEQYVKNHFRNLKFLPIGKLEENGNLILNDNNTYSIKEDVIEAFINRKNDKGVKLENPEFVQFIKLLDTSTKKIKLLENTNPQSNSYVEIERLGIHNGAVEYDIDNNKFRSELIDSKDKVEQKVFDSRYNLNDLQEQELTNVQELGAEEPIVFKENISEVFESNPELANAVYEALGFDKSTFDTKGITLSKETSIGWMFIQLNNKKIGRVKFVNNGEKGQLGLSIEINEEYQNKGYGQIVHILMADLAKKDYKSNLYSDYQNSSQEIQLLNSLVKKGYAEKIGDVGKASKEYPDSFVTEERAFRIKTSDEIRTVTPQQKQEAQRVYSQYLDTIFPDSKVRNIVYRGSEKGIKDDSNPWLYFSDSINDAYMYAKAHISKSGQINERNPVPAIRKILKDYFDSKYGKDSFQSLTINKDVYLTQIDEDKYELNLPEWYKENINLSSEDKDLLNKFDRLDLLYDFVKIESEADLTKPYDDNFYIENIGEYKKLRGWFDNKFGLSTIREKIGKLETAILNIKNPYIDEKNQEDLRNNQSAYKDTHDGAFLMDGEHFLIKNKPKQIHILGSKQDIEGFKEFVTNNIKIDTESGIKELNNIAEQSGKQLKLFSDSVNKKGEEIEKKCKGGKK